jgi:Glycosyltransferase family 87
MSSTKLLYSNYGQSETSEPRMSAGTLLDTLVNERAERILKFLAASVALGLIAIVGVRWYAYQWDFHMFLGAARDFAAGRSPYRGVGLSFYHPPMLLHVYGLFALLPVWLACTVWYVLKLAALAALLSIWNKHFVRIRYNAATIAFLILAYDAAIYSDLVAGNLSIFEELLIWLAFVNLLKGRYWAFGLILLLASQVKITPLFFAVLLVTVPTQPQWGWFFATIVGFFAVFSCNYWLHPDLFAEFFRVSALLDERGTQSPSLLALVRDVLERLNLIVAQQSKLDELAYVAVAGAIGLSSLWLLIKYRKAVKAFDQRLLIGFACVLFAIVSPRLKSYTYILLIPPTLYLLQVIEWRRQVALAGAVIVGLTVFPLTLSLLPVRLLFELFINYIPLFAAAFVWIAYFVAIYRITHSAVVGDTAPELASQSAT